MGVGVGREQVRRPGLSSPFVPVLREGVCELCALLDVIWCGACVQFAEVTFLQNMGFLPLPPPFPGFCFFIVFLLKRANHKHLSLKAHTESLLL